MTGETNNLAFWDKVSQPGEEVLKKIVGGRLAGMSDINPVWRYKVMTEHFGPCGHGWKYTIEDMWTVDGAEGNLMVFAKVNLYIAITPKSSDAAYLINWFDPIPGVGGSKLIAKEKVGLHTDDEAYKKAVTDALGSAMKMLGVGADVYMGRWDGSKYRDAPKVKVTPRKNKSDNQLVYEGMSAEDKQKAESAASSIVDLFALDQQSLLGENETTVNRERAVDLLFDESADHKQATFWMLKGQSSIRRYIQDASDERYRQIELAKDIPQ